MASRLYVGNLPYNVTEEDLRDLFSQAGDIQDVAVIKDRDTQRSRGFGFVEFANQPDAEKAIQMFDSYDMDGRRLTVNMAQERPERSFASGGRGGGRGGHGGGRGSSRQGYW